MKGLRQWQLGIVCSTRIPLRCTAQILLIGIGRACIVVPKFQYNLFVGLLDIRILTVQVEMIFDLHRFIFLRKE